jgi:3-oxoadipate enol-lactonase
MPFVHANGVRLYYEIHGPADRPVLVLNNGILMNAAGSWLPQTAAFSRHWRVLQYDCRGQGLSDHPAAPYSMDMHADDLAALLSALAVERAHVLGISYGGEVAQAFALRYPARVRSLILADTVSEVGPALRLTLEGWKTAARAGDADLLYQVTAPWNFSPAFFVRAETVLRAARERYAMLDLPAVERLCEAFLGVDFTPRLRQIAAPACIIVGERDLLKGPDYAAILHASIPASELHVLPGAGRAASWEAPDGFNRVVLEFLARCEAEPRPVG